MLDKLKAKYETMRQEAALIADQSAAKFNTLRLTDAQRERRYDICKACEWLYKPSMSCKKCGCFMGVKTYLPNSECPIGKWGKEERDNSTENT